MSLVQKSAELSYAGNSIKLDIKKDYIDITSKKGVILLNGHTVLTDDIEKEQCKCVATELSEEETVEVKANTFVKAVAPKKVVIVMNGDNAYLDKYYIAVDELKAIPETDTVTKINWPKDSDSFIGKKCLLEITGNTLVGYYGNIKEY